MGKGDGLLFNLITPLEIFVMYTVKQTESLNMFRSVVGTETFTTADLKGFDYKKLGVVHPGFLCNDALRVKRGEYKFPSVSSVETVVSTPVVVDEPSSDVVPSTVVNLMMTTDVEKMVPDRFNGFVPWGHFKDIKNIIKLLYRKSNYEGVTIIATTQNKDFFKNLSSVNININHGRITSVRSSVKKKYNKK